MITPEAIEAYNARLTSVNLNSIKTLKPGEQDRVINHGSSAEALLLNKDLALFIHEFKFGITDQLVAISGHDAESNARRVALSNQLSGIDGFIGLLKTAVYYKNRVVSLQNGSASPNETTKETLQ